MLMTRSQVIDVHVQRHFRETGTKQIAWANTVAQIYNDRTALEHRTVQFHHGGDAEKDGRANRQILHRMFDPDGEVRLPVDLEEAIVFSLPDAYGRMLRGELAARYGLLNAEIPHGSATDELNDGGLFMTETGRAVMALAPVLADGRIDGNDHIDDLEFAVVRLREVQSIATQLLTRIGDEIRRREDAVKAAGKPGRQTRPVMVA